MTTTTEVTPLTISEQQSTTDTVSSSSSSSSSLVISVRQHLSLVNTVDTTITTENNSPGLDNNKNNNHYRGIRLILASQSPRRKEILDMMGLQNRYEVITSPLDESTLALQLLGKTTTSATTTNPDDVNDDDKQQQQQQQQNQIHYKYSGQVVTDPSDYTRILAEEKARALANQIVLDYNNNNGSNDTQTIENNIPPTLVLGSDTIVVIDDTILEKPTCEEDAIQMLHNLSGRSHLVLTGVALFLVHNQLQTQQEQQRHVPVQQLISSFTDTAIVQFSSLTDYDIRSYVATGEPMDKSGSYGIQGIGGQLVQRVDGDFFTVMGMPMHRTSTMLASAIKSIRTQQQQQG